MANHHLRSYILKLQNHLSDVDRKRLHFFLADDVPRSLCDNATLSGTLNVMESLFDQNKINENDFTYLIKTFEEIECVKAAKLLRELADKKRRQKKCSKQVLLPAEIVPLNQEVIEDQEDKSASQYLLNHINHYENTNNNINPLTINIDNKGIISSKSQEKKTYNIIFKINKHFFLIILSLLMILGICMAMFIVKLLIDNKSACKPNTISSLIEENEQLKNQIIQFETEKNHSLIKAGKIYGLSTGASFDDSVLTDFTYCHYLYGFVARADQNGGCKSYKFLYYSNLNHQEIDSDFHGNEYFSHKGQFEFDKDERIVGVEGEIIEQRDTLSNKTNVTKSIITGLKFLSNQDHFSPSYDDPSGTHFSESFHGYTLGYVIGKADQCIEQLQFFWYRTEK